jgi:chaperonin GroEL
MRTILHNACINPKPVIKAILKGQAVAYDVMDKTFVHDMKSIIDPVKVVRTALENAASVASLMLTTSVQVVTRGDDKDFINELKKMDGVNL